MSVTRDGKQLEALVAFVEKALLPEGFEVRANERVYNDEGAQIAELDVEIRGRIGSTNISWLIECRDRPGDGPAPGAWIEQLVGRRTRFGFNKVTAVSTTGFAGGAVEFALSQGIELREVKALEPEAFENWLMIRSIVSSQSESVLRHATVLIDEGEDQDHFRALGEALTNATTAGDLLRSSKTGTRGTLDAAFLAAVNAAKLFDGVEPNGPPKSIRLTVTYDNDDDHFVVETRLGPVRVRSIVFDGDLRQTENLIPLSITAEYRHQVLEYGQRYTLRHVHYCSSR